jgi:hypothetical protein
MFKILLLTTIIGITFLYIFIKKCNQVPKMIFTELNYLSELRKRSDRNYLRSGFEKWKCDKFRKLWFIYVKTDMSESFNKFCWGIFKKKITIEIKK